jgi:hypothetical protein
VKFAHSVLLSLERWKFLEYFSSQYRGPFLGFLSTSCKSSPAELCEGSITFVGENGQKEWS